MIAASCSPQGALGAEPVQGMWHLRGANDNAPAGEACVTDAGTPLPSRSLTASELQILVPLIEALALMAMNDLSDAPLASDRKVCR